MNIELINLIGSDRKYTPAEMEIVLQVEDVEDWDADCMEPLLERFDDDQRNQAAEIILKYRPDLAGDVQDVLGFLAGTDKLEKLSKILPA